MSNVKSFVFLLYLIGLWNLSHGINDTTLITGDGITVCQYIDNKGPFETLKRGKENDTKIRTNVYFGSLETPHSSSNIHSSIHSALLLSLIVQKLDLWYRELP
ncbi:PREDICTED: uncharacterized protein LOC108613392 [Drosophila arizonae]|uniref:Uncharacterized protein LOC108613392 n=1 Tax=Drosophila arizonae TaxID=7263 RepID=A0ABM1P522_DROAR|nr:PREDICTED: uncharacterized protein LOC108613392 [Drosophila arizonae]